MHGTNPALSLVATLAIGPLASGAIVVYGNGAVGDGWATGWKSHWSETSVTTPTHSGSAAALKRAEFRIDAFNATTGTSVIGNPVLEFYVNFVTDAATPGHSYTRLDVTDKNGLHEMGTRGPGVTWTVDGVAHTDREVIFDADPATWQRVRIDLSQTYYVYSNGFEIPGPPIDLASIKLVTASSYLGTTGGAMTYYDDIQFIPVPEPSSALPLGASACLLVLRRWRPAKA